MRSFIAIAIPDSVKAQLHAAAKRLEPHAEEVTWCLKDQFHLTLAFLGETSPAILPHIAEKLSQLSSSFQPFTCRAYGYGFFGSKRNPKTIWVGAEPVKELGELNEALWEMLKKFGFQTEPDAFRPHITLGRCKERARNHPLILAMDEEEQVDFGSWPVDGMTLFESRLTPKGAIYSKLNRFPFRG
jgi:RNA 2',3'-cyclic 3'-phosphodiesterase